MPCSASTATASPPAMRNTSSLAFRACPCPDESLTTNLSERKHHKRVVPAERGGSGHARGPAAEACPIVFGWPALPSETRLCGLRSCVPASTRGRSRISTTVRGRRNARTVRWSAWQGGRAGCAGRARREAAMRSAGHIDDAGHRLRRLAKPSRDRCQIGAQLRRTRPHPAISLCLAKTRPVRKWLIAQL
jgi:hypothetical protein